MDAAGKRAYARGERDGAIVGVKGYPDPHWAYQRAFIHNPGRFSLEYGQGFAYAYVEAALAGRTIGEYYAEKGLTFGAKG